MSARTLLERLRKHLRARNDADLAMRTGLGRGEVSKIHNGLREEGMRLCTLKTVSEHTGVPIGALAEWWAEPEDQPREQRVRAAGFPTPAEHSRDWRRELRE